MKRRVAQESRDLVPGGCDHGDPVRRGIAGLHNAIFLAIYKEHGDADQDRDNDDTNQEWK